MSELEEQPEYLLHIYGQYLWHDDCQIVGTRNSLTALRDLIDLALKDGKSYGSDFFVGDGEGYDIAVCVREDDWDKWGKFIVPYTAEYAQDNADGAVDPRYLGPHAYEIYQTRSDELGYDTE